MVPISISPLVATRLVKTTPQCYKDGRTYELGMPGHNVFRAASNGVQGTAAVYGSTFGSLDSTEGFSSFDFSN